jgi:hypothetical protein
MAKVLALAALFAAGVLVAGFTASVGSADTTTTVTVPTTTTQTVSTTAVETTTVQQTTTAPATTVVTTATAPTTTAAESTSSGTPAWVWALLAVLGAAVIGLLIYVLTRRGAAIPDHERRLLLRGAIESWTAQGWALLSETADTAVLQHGNDRMTVTVDPAGQVAAHRLAPPPSPPVSEQPTQRMPEQPSDDHW